MCSLISQIWLIWSHKSTFSSTCHNVKKQCWQIIFMQACTELSRAPHQKCMPSGKPCDISVRLSVHSPQTCATKNILHYQQSSVIMCMGVVDRTNQSCSHAGRPRCFRGSAGWLDAFHSCHTIKKGRWAELYRLCWNTERTVCHLCCTG